MHYWLCQLGTDLTDLTYCNEATINKSRIIAYQDLIENVNVDAITNSIQINSTNQLLG